MRFVKKRGELGLEFDREDRCRNAGFLTRHGKVFDISVQWETEYPIFGIAIQRAKCGCRGIKFIFGALGLAIQLKRCEGP